MIVQLRLDPKLVWRLSDAAEARGLTLGEHIAALVTPPVNPKMEAADRTRADVVALHAQGFTDEEIAARVNRVQEHVARLRRAAGLKPNRKKVI